MKHKFITIGEIMLRLTPPDYEKIRTATSFEARYGGSEAVIYLSIFRINKVYNQACIGFSIAFLVLGSKKVRVINKILINCYT